MLTGSMHLVILLLPRIVANIALRFATDADRQLAPSYLAASSYRIGGKGNVCNFKNYLLLLPPPATISIQRIAYVSA
jgi:hypothetical protein